MIRQANQRFLATRLYNHKGHCNKTTKAGSIELYKCPQCDFANSEKAQIKSHLKNVHKLPPFGCPHCSEGFTNFSKLQQHVRKAHEGHLVPNEPYEKIISDSMKQIFAQNISAESFQATEKSAINSAEKVKKAKGSLKENVADLGTKKGKKGKLKEDKNTQKLEPKTTMAQTTKEKAVEKAEEKVEEKIEKS